MILFESENGEKLFPTRINGNYVIFCQLVLLIEGFRKTVILSDSEETNV